ncbi:MAG: hypothetical protein IIB40_12055 [Candidatus Marinimicrobia bacterium]|nr:hypothetical protein [Candidatus Neomarinimicrobiota bacterium]
MGDDITPPGHDGKIFRVRVIEINFNEEEDVLFTEITDITGTETSIKFGDRQFDASGVLREVSFAKARARITTQSFEPSGEYSDSYKEYKKIRNCDRSSDSIQLQILNCLLNIRKLNPNKFKYDQLDIVGLMLLLDISEDDYLFNAGLLLEKRLVGQPTIDQLNIENGGIFITHEGIEYLNEKGGSSKVYGVGEAYKFHLDLKKKLSEVKNSVFIIDPYFDAESFDLYLPDIPTNVRVKILLNNSTDRFRTVVQKFRASGTTKLEVRESLDIHDRLLFIDDRCWAIGQSIKDAAMKKPTYVVLSEGSEMLSKYNTIWEEAQSL